MKITLHQTHISIADFEAIYSNLTSTFEQTPSEGVHVYPELYLTGYPLQDLCLNKSFLKGYEALLKRVNDWSVALPSANNLMILMGGLKYNLDVDGSILTIENVIYKLQLGSQLEVVSSKVLLPNYDIFDEKKYFTPGLAPKILEFMDKKIGLLICEDMWPSSSHKVNPVEVLKSTADNLDVVINLSASPFDLFKSEKRVKRAMEISSFLGCPFAYVNKVGGEDEVLFDGGSFFITDQGVNQAHFFGPDKIVMELTKNTLKPSDSLVESVPSTWEGLFEPALELAENKLPSLRSFDGNKPKIALDALMFGVQEYAKKSGFKKFLIALSGGIDSALVLAIVKLSLKPGQSVEAVYMPSQYSRDISEELSIELCKNLEIPLKIYPISTLHEKIRKDFNTNFSAPMAGLADENIQSRLRGSIIYTRSNQSGSMVINTSNKSELAVGYSTLYGDSVGAISLLGDLYKSEVFSLAQYINDTYSELIPLEIISRPPSAELRDDQEDAQSLPAYERLDAILEGILSYRMTATELIEKGFSGEEVSHVVNLYKKSEYKRSQFCPILKLKPKSFGFGYRVPLSKSTKFYSE